MKQKGIQHKSTESIEGAIKDVDRKSGVVTGYFAAFDIKDSDKDIIRRGAFNKSIGEMGAQGKDLIFHLHQHDAGQVLGKPHVLVEDEFGLYFETKFADTRLANDVLALYEAGVYKQHSIGFQYLPDKTIHHDKGDSEFFELLEVKLYEGSTVTWGANSSTPFTGFKSEQEKEEKIQQEIKSILRAIKSVDGLTDETYRLMELRVLNLTKKLSEPLVSTPKVSEPSEKSDTQKGVDYNYLIQNFKL